MLTSIIAQDRKLLLAVAIDVVDKRQRLRHTGRREEHIVNEVSDYAIPPAYSSQPCIIYQHGNIAIAIGICVFDADYGKRSIRTNECIGDVGSECEPIFQASLIRDLCA